MKETHKIAIEHVIALLGTLVKEEKPKPMTLSQALEEMGYGSVGNDEHRCIRVPFGVIGVRVVRTINELGKLGFEVTDIKTKREFDGASITVWARLKVQ